MTSSTQLHFSPILTIPDYLVSEVQSKLAYADERIRSVTIVPSGDDIQLTFMDALDDEDKAVIKNKVQRVITSMVQGAFKPKIQVLEDFLDRPIPGREDPMPELFRRGEISQETMGVYVLGPLLTRLIAWFEERFVDLADSFAAKPYRFPTLIPARYMERVGYFRAFPHSLSFATHLHSELDNIDQFAQQAACDEHGNLAVPMERFAQIEALLSPAVCYHLYFALADKPLPNGKVVATAVGNCFRYESSNLTSLERLWNFTMREVIFVGPKEFVLENRAVARQRMQKVFEEIGMAYRVESANDPFFIGEFRKQAAFQSAFQLKYEIRARLPFKESTLAVGSYNYHQDFFGRHLNITLPDGSPTHTGCVAFGLERIAFAFLAQFGFDTAKWPLALKEIV